MKLIGFDYGMRRIGVAVTDETGEFIRSLPTIDKKKSPRLADAVLSLIEEEKPAAIVMGLPLSARDSDTTMSRRVRMFAEEIGKRASLPVQFVDESLTSLRANDIIRMRKKKHRRAKENIDRIAACLILEAFQKEKQ